MIRVLLADDQTLLRGGLRIAGRDVDDWEYVGFGVLPSQLAGIAFVQGEVFEEVQLAGETHPGFVDRPRTYVPHIGDLGIVVVHVAGLATDGTGEDGAWVHDRSVALCVGYGDAVVRLDVVIQPAEELPIRRGLQQAGAKVILHFPFRTDCSPLTEGEK